MKFLQTLTAGAALLSLTACSTIGLGGAPSLPSPSSILLDGLDVPAISENIPVALLSTGHPTCLKFYENTASFAAIPTAALGVDLPSVPGMPGLPSLPGKPELPGVPGIPKGPSFATSMIKTLVLGTLSGVVGGGVSSLGIGSEFVESALIGTATQVTYNTGETVYDSILGGKAPDPSTAEGQAAIAAAAAHNVASHTHGSNGDVIVHSPAAASAAAGTAATATHMGAIASVASQLGCPAPDSSAIAALKLLK